jgi:Protein of unknown function (DUF3383)
VIDDLNYNVRKLVRSVMGMPADSVRPAKQSAPAGGQMDEMATVDIIDDAVLGTGARSYDTVGTVPSDITTERVDQDHKVVASVNFYRRPPTSAYLRGFTVSAVAAGYAAILDGAFDISIDGVNRQISGLDFTGVTTMAMVAAVIQARLQAALAATTCVWDATNARFVVTSPTNGQTSAVLGAVAPTAIGTDVSTVLGLTIGGGAISVNNRAGIARYSNAAFDRAARLVQRLRLSAFVAQMNAVGLSFVSASKPRNLTALVDGDTWESRGQVDLTFAVVARETATIQTVLIVPLTTHSQAPGGAVHTDTAEVTA